MEKKKFVRQSAALSLEDLEKTAEKLSSVTTKKETVAAPPPAEKETMYSYSVKLDAVLEQRVAAAVKKHGQTKKGFFLLAIEERLDRLGF